MADKVETQETAENTQNTEETAVKTEEQSNPNEEYKQLQTELEGILDAEKAAVDKKSDEKIPDESQQTEEDETEQVEAEEEMPAEEPPVDPNLYDLAVELGFSDDEINGMSSAGVLGKTLTKLIKASQNTQPAEKPAEPKSSIDDDGYKINLNKEEIDSSIVEEFEKMSKYFNDKIKELNKINADLREKDIQNERNSFVDWFDKEVDALGDYKHIFGTSQEARNKA